MTMKKRKNVPYCEGEDEMSVDALNPAKRRCHGDLAQSGVEQQQQQSCRQGWWPSLPAVSMAQAQEPPCPPSSWPPQPSANPSQLRQPAVNGTQQAGDVEMADQPLQEVPDVSPAAVPAGLAPRNCARCMAGEPVSGQGHLRHISSVEPPPPNSAPHLTHSISFLAHYIPLPPDYMV